MVPFILQRGISPELNQFPHISEFSLTKVTTICLDSFSSTFSDCLRIYYITEGKFEWVIKGESHTLYPTDIAIVLPGQELFAEKRFLEIGNLYYLSLLFDFPIPNTGSPTSPNIWNGILFQEYATIRKLLTMGQRPIVLKLQDAGSILIKLRNEIFDQEIGFLTRVNQLLGELLILTTRKLTHQHFSLRDFPSTFLKLEQSLRKDLSHPWTVEEMAALTGLGTTAFSDKVKSFSGFSPINYLINIRISEAIKRLKKPNEKVTDIALDTGFYSSQHFSTTFKKLTGYTPRQFRNINVSK